MQQGSCCPKGSWPRLQVDYKSKGVKLQIGNTQCYHVGSGKKVLILISDIFGAFSSNHQSFADTFFSLGYNVYLPQLLGTPYDGPMSMPQILASIKSQSYPLMQQRFHSLLKHISSHQPQSKVFVIGFCWGVWLAFKMAGECKEIIAIGGMHPSLGIEQMFGGTEEDLTKGLGCPAFLYPAGNDPHNIKQGGTVVKILQEKFGKDKTGTHQFPDMIHGWTVRGQVSDEKVNRDVKLAIELCDQYFSKFQ